MMKPSSTSKRLVVYFPSGAAAARSSTSRRGSRKARSTSFSVEQTLVRAPASIRQRFMCEAEPRSQVDCRMSVPIYAPRGPRCFDRRLHARCGCRSGRFVSSDIGEDRHLLQAGDQLWPVFSYQAWIFLDLVRGFPSPRSARCRGPGPSTSQRAAQGGNAPRPGALGFLALLSRGLDVYGFPTLVGIVGAGRGCVISAAFSSRASGALDQEVQAGCIQLVEVVRVGDGWWPMPLESRCLSLREPGASAGGLISAVADLGVFGPVTCRVVVSFRAGNSTAFSFEARCVHQRLRPSRSSRSRVMVAMRAGLSPSMLP